MKQFYKRWQFYVLVIILLVSVLDLILNHNPLWLPISTIIVVSYLIFEEIKEHPIKQKNN